MRGNSKQRQNQYTGGRPMIIKCPKCEKETQYSPRDNKDFIKVACSGCGQLFTASTVRCEAREEVYTNR